MNQVPSLRPNNARRTSRIPGGFDTDDEQSPTRSVFNDAASSNGEFDVHAHTFTEVDQDSIHPQSQFTHDQEMTKHLTNMESSFLPELTSDSLVASEDVLAPTPSHDNSHINDSGLLTAFKNSQSHTFDKTSSEYPDYLNTSSLETISSSPTAAAAARTVSRVVSMASMDGYETAREDGGSPERGYDDGYTSASEHHDDEFGDDVDTPKKGSPIQDSSGPAMPQLSTHSVTPARNRPQYLTSRFSSNRNSRSSIQTSTSNELESDMGTPSEYALQTGGATSLGGSSTPLRPDDTLSRSISLGSVASGISQLGPDETPKVSDLSILQEEGSPPSSVLTTRKASHDVVPQTPLRTSHTPDTITDTVLNQHVHGMNIPSTVVRNFARDFPERPRSPDRRSALNTPSVGKMKNMTLKEQSGMIDRLQKENWQLKLKVYYMDQMLNARTDEGMKSIMTENVSLKTEKLKLAKDLRDAKRSNRDLHAKLKDKDERLSVLSNATKGVAQPSKQDSVTVLENEITILHEHIISYQTDIETLREEIASKDNEKNHLAEIVKSMDEQRRNGDQVDTSKEIQIWRDLIDTEASQRQQAEDENRKLHEELWRLKSEASSAVSGQRSELANAARHRGARSGDGSTRPTLSRDNSLLVEEMRQEIEDLRRDLGAQTSMLTSRNREKEKLYREIEELKMGHRQDRRSSSATRGRPYHSYSESQNGEGYDGEVDTETLRTQIDELRDAHAKMSMENQDLSTSIEGLLDELDEKELRLSELEKAKQEYDELMKQTDTELLAMQSERDEALQAHEEVENAFQDLREEAQQSVDILEDDLERSAQAIQQLEHVIKQRNDESDQLRNQVRMAREGLDKIEADVQAKIRRINEVEMENQEITRELETIEDSLTDANMKLENVSVELESKNSECAFLREDQEVFVLKIGDLETALKAAQTNLQSEKDKIKDLETRITNERQQQETVGSKEKQEVQKLMNDLNREATAAKDDARELRKRLDTRNIELESWKERLSELENGLQRILGDGHGKSNYIFVSFWKCRRSRTNHRSRLQKFKESLSLHSASSQIRSTIFLKRTGCSNSKMDCLRNMATMLDGYMIYSKRSRLLISLTLQDMSGSKRHPVIHLEPFLKKITKFRNLKQPGQLIESDWHRSSNVSKNN